MVAGPDRGGARRRARQPRAACARGCEPPTRRRTTRGSTPSRVIPNTINEFPSFSFVLGDLHAHVVALPFTRARADVRAAGRAARPARRPALASGRGGARRGRSRSARCTRSTRGRIPVAAGAAGRRGRSSWLRDPRSEGRRGYAWSGSALVLVASFVLILPFVLNFDPEARGIGDRRTTRRPFAQVAGRHGADLRHPRVAADRPPTRAGCSLARHAGAGSAGAWRAASSPARCWRRRT